MLNWLNGNIRMDINMVAPQWGLFIGSWALRWWGIGKGGLTLTKLPKRGD